jgi:hypothetical protein
VINGIGIAIGIERIKKHRLQHVHPNQTFDSFEVYIGATNRKTDRFFDPDLDNDTNEGT